jgi:predicted nucleic acid-binding protein
MRVLDASSALYAWDNYPIENLPTLWSWLESEIAAGRIVVPRVALDEIGHISPECRQWLHDLGGFMPVEVDNVIASHALLINGEIGVQNDQYGTGVDANDVIIIATAKARGFALISNESRQPSLPSNKKKYKIPAVCNLQPVGVTCINFADLIRSSNRVF